MTEGTFRHLRTWQAWGKMMPFRVQNCHIPTDQFEYLWATKTANQGLKAENGSLNSWKLWKRYPRQEKNYSKVLNLSHDSQSVYLHTSVQFDLVGAEKSPSLIISTPSESCNSFLEKTCLWQERLRRWGDPFVDWCSQWVNWITSRLNLQFSPCFSSAFGSECSLFPTSQSWFTSLAISQHKNSSAI